ncbi:MAG: HigA family addiction module antidote protein [Magnetococcales bacterium]|nr:HigA family addiction module antidote protein [Magnetococcales bacterium]
MLKLPIITDGGIPDLHLPPIHPGEILAEEMEYLELSANALAQALGVPPNRITAILNGRRSITADTAIRLAHYFGTTAKFWMNLQSSYDLVIAERDRGEDISKKVKTRLSLLHHPDSSSNEIPLSAVTVSNVFPPELSR